MVQNATGLHRARSNFLVLPTLLLAVVFAGARWLVSSHVSNEISFVGNEARTGLTRAIDAAARRRGCTAREAVGLFYSTQTGNTETVAGVIAEKAGVEAMDVGEISAEDLAGYDGLLVGCPTWEKSAQKILLAMMGCLW